jgi:hypothetical protein
MRVFSYVVTGDTGFAPNPFHGYCTLACCKPKIRLRAKVGDLVVGLSTRCEGIVYAMRIDRRLTFAEYWSDPAFATKRADWAGRTAVERAGDNIYEPVGNGDHRQAWSRHSNLDGTENPKMKRLDLSGQAVLVGQEFVYFGGTPHPLPRDLIFLTIGRNHRSRFSAREVATIEQWFAGQPRGVGGKPARWPVGDESWRG